IAGITAQMESIVAEGITEQELSDAKAYLTGSYPLSFDSNAKIASGLMSARLEDLGVDYFDRRNAMVEAVTLEDVNRIAAEYLQPSNFTFIVVGEPEGIEETADLPMPLLGQIDVDEAGDMEESNIDEASDAVRDPNR
ncbi:MAG: insulinase family protein, partial [Henriciella sp.]|nr:insulinase family protein [Henriciella sp.]